MNDLILTSLALGSISLTAIIFATRYYKLTDKIRKSDLEREISDHNRRKNQSQPIGSSRFKGSAHKPKATNIDLYISDAEDYDQCPSKGSTLYRPAPSSSSSSDSSSDSSSSSSE